ncbi:7TM diverse intracellular signaling domain-containing protein [Caenimonas terrae]|uniref:7TM diverse intracellular signaling domain-containing protein n=1 Tax=Caenimonas terrae TaxID=696074 RepID=A0ABW0NEN3_9BURK
MRLGCWLGCALALVLALGWPAASFAGDVAIGNNGSYSLSREFSFLEDADAKLDFEQVRQQDQQGRFAALPSDSPGPNFGITSAAIWLKVTLRPAADAPANWLLEVAYAPLGTVELFAPDATGAYAKQSAGVFRPFATRVIPHRNHVLPVTLRPGMASTLYLHVRSEGSVTVPATLWQPAALWNHDQLAYGAFGLYFGLLIGLFIYNLLLYVSVRDKVYLVYVGYVAGMALFQVTLTGLGNQFLWPDLVWWNSRSPPAGTVMVATFGLLFARTFLLSAARTPLLDKFILAQVGGYMVSLVVLLAYSYTLASYLTTGLVLVSVTTLMVAGIFGVRHGHPGARNFLIAWAVLLLSVVLQALHNIGTLPSNVLTSNAVLFGSALEMLLLSFALADRINVARRFKEQAQVRLAAERALIQAMSVSHEQLKTTLEEREAIIDNSIVGIAFLTPQGRMRWANPRMLDILGARGRDIESMEPFYLSRDQYLEIGRAVAERVKRGRVYETEIRIRRLDGREIWIALSGKGVVLEGRVRGTVWVIVDITRRKELEEELHEALTAAQKAREFAATTPEGDE